VKKIAASLLGMGLFASAGWAAEQGLLTADQHRALQVKPSVVRLYEGCQAQIAYEDAELKKVYDIDVGFVGSGVVIDAKGYIATNSHVVETTHGGEAACKKLMAEDLINQIAADYKRDPSSFTEDELTTIGNSATYESAKQVAVVITPKGDVLPFEIKSFGTPNGGEKDVAIVKVEMTGMPVAKLSEASVRLQDHVTAVGYPGAADSGDGLLDARNLQASFTDGKVSAVKASAGAAPIIQISAAINGGNSGGPVINDAGEVIGLSASTGVEDGARASGVGFVVAASTVMEYAKSAGAVNAQGTLDTLYSDGLNLAQEGYLSKAMEKFEQVKRLYPHHSEIEDLISQTQSAISSGKDRKDFPWKWLTAGVGGLGALLLLIVIAARSGRKTGAVPSPSPWNATGALPPSVPQPMPPSGNNSPPPPAPMPPPLVPPAMAKSSAPPPMGAPSSAPMPSTPIPRGNADATMAMSLPSFGSIEFLSGPLAGQKFPIPMKGTAIGRDGSQAQIVIVDSNISKRHCWIGPRDGQIMLVDEGSTNGTYLGDMNAERVRSSVLKSGDVVVLAGNTANFRYTS
jgi:serine protease Do